MYIKRIIDIKRGPKIPFSYSDMPVNFIHIDDEYYYKVESIDMVLSDMLNE